MLSRVADSLYWMSRFLERAEHSARLMGVHLNLVLEQEPESAGRLWSRMLACLGNTEPIEADPFIAAQNYTLDQIVTCIMAARENARQVREQISSEMWEQLNRLFHESKRMGTVDFWDAQPHEFLNTVNQSSHQFQGVTDSTMSHGEGWQFIQVGRFIERVSATATLLDVHFREYLAANAEPMNSAEHMEWIGLLRSCTAFEAYCKVYTADLRPERVAEFLLFHNEFPHSVRFAVDRLQQSLEAIHDSTSIKNSARLAKLAGRLAASLTFTPLEEIMNNLHEFFAGVQRQCGQIHSGIYQVYITYPIEAALDA